MTEVHNPVNPCIICLEVSPGLIQFRGSCSCAATIHTNCLNHWFEKNSRTCPICRVPYNPRPVEKKEEPESSCCYCCGLLCFVEIVILAVFIH